MTINNIDTYISLNKNLYRHLDLESSGMDVVIKGHLLIEEVVFKILEASVINKGALKEANLSFHKAACVVKALHENKTEAWVWDSVIKLNSIRNKVAHNLEHPAVEALLEEFSDFVCQNGDGTIEVGSQFGFNALPMAVMNIHRYLWKILDKIQAR